MSADYGSHQTSCSLTCFISNVSCCFSVHYTSHSVPQLCKSACDYSFFIYFRASEILNKAVDVAYVGVSILLLLRILPFKPPSLISIQPQVHRVHRCCDVSSNFQYNNVISYGPAQVKLTLMMSSNNMYDEVSKCPSVKMAL